MKGKGKRSGKAGKGNTEGKKGNNTWLRPPEISFPVVEEVAPLGVVLLRIKISAGRRQLDDETLAGTDANGNQQEPLDVDYNDRPWPLLEVWRAQIKDRQLAEQQSRWHQGSKSGFSQPPQEVIPMIDELDLSKNAISDRGTQRLFHWLTEEQIVVRKLLLYQNEIGDFGAYFLAYYLGQQKYFPAARASGHFVEEVHLSHNCITQNGCRRILEGLDEAHQYPIVASNGRTWPLWIRINDNFIESAAEFVQEMEQLCAKRRGTVVTRTIYEHQEQHPRYHGSWAASPTPYGTTTVRSENVYGCAEGAVFKLLAEKDRHDPFFNSYPTMEFPLRECLPIAHFLYAQRQRVGGGSNTFSLGGASSTSISNPSSSNVVLVPRNVANAIPVCPYTPEHRILLLGEGDFSFTKALARMFGPRHAQNLVASTYDLEGRQNFRDRLLASQQEVEAMGGVVLSESIDCTQLHVEGLQWVDPYGNPIPQYSSAGPHRLLQNILARISLGTPRDHVGGGTALPLQPNSTTTISCSSSPSFFDYIIVNFLHSGVAQSTAPAGTIGGLEEHQELFRNFFWSLRRCAHSFVRPERTRVHVTLADRFPYTHWNVPRIAEECGWQQVGDKFLWAAELYQAFGYEHTRTNEAQGIVGSQRSRVAGIRYTGDTLRDTSFTWEFKLGVPEASMVFLPPRPPAGAQMNVAVNNYHHGPPNVDPATTSNNYFPFPPHNHVVHGYNGNKSWA
ncbi:unnamed protein product [Amoebophrya sp. A25]|nr:unnamed protein product [Amoebophrya sp. A25]|eukprot:GSA25T00010701001.1